MHAVMGAAARILSRGLCQGICVVDLWAGVVQVLTTAQREETEAQVAKVLRSFAAKWQLLLQRQLDDLAGTPTPGSGALDDSAVGESPSALPLEQVATRFRPAVGRGCSSIHLYVCAWCRRPFSCALKCIRPCLHGCPRLTKRRHCVRVGPR